MNIYWRILFLAGVFTNVCIAKIEQQQCNNQDFESKIFDPKHTICLQKYLNQTGLIEEFNDAIVDDSLHLFMNNNCPKLRQTLECFDAYYNEFSSCISYFQKSAVKVIRQVIVTSIDYICAKDGLELIKFINDDGLDCILSNKESLRECGVNLISEDLVNTITVDDQTIPKINFSSKMFSGNECRLLYNTSHCMVDVLNSGCTNKSAHFASNLVINLFKQTPCWGLVGLLDVKWEHYLFALLLPKRIPTKDRQCNDTRSAYDVAQTSLQEGSKCWNRVIDNDFMINDLQHAFESKALYTFLKKYCPKLHGIGSCVGDYLDSFQQCVDGEDSVILDSTKKIIEGIANFICHRDGERILLFMKEDGFECLEQQQDNIKDCVKSTGITTLFDNSDIDIDFNNPIFNPINIIGQIWVPQDYSPQECRTLVSLEVCVYKMMRKCKERSPANLISSLVRSVARKSPCWDINISGSDSITPNFIIMVTLTLIPLFYTGYKFE